jgi:hypothetical protein
VDQAPTSPKQSNPPTREQLIQALLYLIEGHDVPPRYVEAIKALVLPRRVGRRASMRLGTATARRRGTHISIRRVIAPSDKAPGFGESGLPGHLLHCPSCRSDYVAWSGPPIVDRCDDSSAWEGRGSLLTIPMQGECGHDFEISLGFHKGGTWLFVSSEAAA